MLVGLAKGKIKTTALMDAVGRKEMLDLNLLNLGRALAQQNYSMAVDTD
jgi:hypothetical protein